VNASNTLQALLKYDVVPIVNENDTVAVEEIKFGDNDTLAAMVAGLADADLLINLSDVDGLFDKNPSEHADAKLIPIVKRIDRGVEDIAEGTSTHVGTGGMSTKIKAAKMCSQIGITMIVANGRQPDAIAKAIAGECGTRFLPYHKSTLRPRQRWIAFGAAVRGTITVNVGARVQVVEGGKSLLPAGIVDVAGRFRSGEMVKLVDESGKAFAQGFVNYDHESLRQIMGLHTAEISDVLGSKPSDEVVHRDNMVFTFS
jgi:glutamate 5-kinase